MNTQCNNDNVVSRMNKNGKKNQLVKASTGRTNC